MAIDFKGFLSSPLQTSTDMFNKARQPGGFLSPVTGFDEFLSDPRVSIGLKIAQGEPLGKAVFEGAVQANSIAAMQDEAQQRKDDAKLRSDIKAFRENLQDPNFDPSSIDLADLSQVDLSGVVSALTDEAVGENLVEAYDASKDTLVYASPFEIKQNDNLIPKSASKFATDRVDDKNFAYIVTNPNTNEKYNAFATKDGRVEVNIPQADGTIIGTQYTPDMFGDDTIANITTVGNLGKRDLSIGQFLKVRKSVVDDEKSLRKLATFITREEGLAQGMEKLVDQFATFTKTLQDGNDLTDRELAQAVQEGTLQGLIGAFRLEVVGGGVMTEQDAIRILTAIGGDPANLTRNKEAAISLLSNIFAEKHQLYQDNLLVYNNERGAFTGYDKKEPFELNDYQKNIFDANALLQIDVNAIPQMTLFQLQRVNLESLTPKQQKQWENRYTELKGQ
jgi:hypothetical protein